MDPLSFEERIPSTDPEREEERRRQQTPLSSIQPAPLTQPIRPAVAESTSAVPSTPPGTTRRALTEADLLAQDAVSLESPRPPASGRPLTAEEQLLSQDAVGTPSISLRENVQGWAEQDVYRESTIGESLSGGISQIAQNIANVAQELSEGQVELINRMEQMVKKRAIYPTGGVIDELIQEVDVGVSKGQMYANKGAAVLLDYISLYAQDLADHFYTEPTDAPLFSVSGVTDLVFRQGPNVAASAVGLALSPALGTAFMMSQSAGEIAGSVKEYERNTGEKVPERQVLGLMAFGGVANMYLDKVGLGAVTNVAGGALTKQTLKKMGMATWKEGFTETLQEGVLAGTEMTYQDRYTVAENLPQRLGYAFAGGAILGGLMSGAAGGVNALVTPTEKADASLSGFKLEGDFYAPTFFVTKQGHEMEGRTISMQEAFDSDLVLPKFRQQLLAHQIKKTAQNMTPDQLNGLMLMVNQQATDAGMDVDTYLSTTSLQFTNRQMMESSDLMQLISTGARLTRKDYAELIRAQNMVRNAPAMGIKRKDAIQRATLSTGWILQKNGQWKKGIRAVMPKQQEALKAAFLTAKNLNKTTRYKTTLGEFVGKSEPLLKYYPELANVKIAIVNRTKSNYYGIWLKDKNTIEVNIAFAEKDYENAFIGRNLKTANPEYQAWYKFLGQTVAHEAQHAIADLETGKLEQGGDDLSYKTEGPLDPRFEATDPGISAEFRAATLAGNTDRVKEIKDQFWTWVDSNYKSRKAYGDDFYRRLRGEVDARLAENLMSVQFRAQMLDMARTPEEAMWAQTLLDIAVEQAEVEVQISDTVWRTKDQISEAERSLMAVAKGDVKGAIAVAKQGQIIAKMFNGSNFYTVAHELAHVFRLNLPAKKRRQLEKLYGIKQTAKEDGYVKWEPAMEERFAQDYLSYLNMQVERLSKGNSRDARYTPFFKNFSDMLETSILQMMGGDVSLAQKELYKLDNDTVKVFDAMFTKEYGSMSVLEAPTKVSRLYAKLYKYLSISKYAKMIGIPQTGLAGKDMFNVWNSSIQDGAFLIAQVSELVDGDRRRMTDAFLAAEDADLVNDIRARRRAEQVAEEQEVTIDEDVDTTEEETISLNEIDPETLKAEIEQRRFEDAVLAFRSYFDDSEAELIRAGAFQKGFIARIISELEYKINKLGNDPKELKELNELMQDLQKAQSTRFIHISVQGLLDSLNQTNKSSFRRALTLLTAKQRKTIRFADLLEGPDAIASIDDLQVENVIRHYANRKGRDLAILNIKNVGELEGSVLPYNGTDQELNFVDPKSVPFMDGKQVHPFVMDLLSQLMEPVETSNIIQVYLRHSKMGQFFNPILMPLYNAVQMLQVGVGFIANPIATTRAIVNGFTDYVNRTDRYKMYEAYGLSSQPDVIIQSDQERMYQIAAFTGRFNRVKPVATPLGFMRGYFEYVRKGHSNSKNRKRTAPDGMAEQAYQGLSNVMEQGGRSVIGLYNVIGDISWAGDSISRAITARYLQDVKGMSPKQAALEASRATGMYSDVPRGTRRVLNFLFFTPTFKIAMGNFFFSSLSSMATILNKDTRNMYHKEKAMVVVRTLGIFFAFDFLMTAVLGFEREELGRRYYRRVVTQDTEERFPRGEKELVLTWSSPHNLFSKYIAKMNTVLNDPATLNPVQTFQSQFAYEFHPAFSIIGNITENARSVSREKIYNVFDSPEVKGIKIARYFFGNTYGIFRAIIDKDLDPRGRELMIENYDKGTDFVVGLIGFPYERDLYETRVKAQVEALIRTYKEEVGLTGITQRILAGELTRKQLDDIIKNTTPTTKEFLERLDQILDDLDEYYYPTSPGYYETPDMEETKRRMGGFDMDRKVPFRQADLDFGGRVANEETELLINDAVL